jgi:N-acetyltransferase 10
VSRKAAAASLAGGVMPSGDLIPWTVGQQFQDSEFPRLSGARIVRIAVHPELSRGG